MIPASKPSPTHEPERAPLRVPALRASLRGAARDARDRRLVERAQRVGDTAARAEAVSAFMPLVRHVARRYGRSEEPLEDLEQVASLGLLKAIAGFDLSRTTPFVVYAVPTITGELRRHFRDKTWMVRPPRALVELSLRLEREAQAATASLGRAPTTAELARRLGVSEERLLEAREAAHAMRPTSLDRTAAPEGGDPGEALVDRLGREEEGFASVERALTLRPHVRALTRRDRELLYLRFGQELTQAEIGARLGISQMHVSRTLRTLLAHLGEAADPTPGRPRTP